MSWMKNALGKKMKENDSHSELFKSVMSSRQKKNNKQIQCGKPCSWPVEYNVFIQTTKAALGYLN